MSKTEKITSITFNQTSNIFINAGIVGLARFIEKFRIAYPDKFPSLKYSPLSKNELTIQCEELMEFLEEVYYFMGKEIYDTYSSEQLENAQKGKDCNLFYSEEKDDFIPFPKIKSYGLPELFTNGRPKNTKREDNQSKIAVLKKENPVLADKFISEFEKRGIKLGSVIYFNESYTTIPRLLKPTNAYLQSLKDKKNTCILTGESYSKLLDVNNNSVFIKKQGINNFKSFFNNISYRISWKAMYLIRFAPALCYFSYQNSYDTIICNFFNSNNLENIAKLYETPMFRQKEEMAKITYLLNFNLKDFSIKKKSGEDIKIETTKDAVWESEIAFMLLYTFYKDQFEGQIIDESEEENSGFFDPFEDNPLDKIPISLVTFRADKFASTMRPNFFEEYNNVKYIFRLIYALDSGNIKFQPIWQGLKLNSPKAKMMKSKPTTFGKGKAVERQIRALVLGKILKGQTIIHDIEKLFFDSYKYLLANENPGYRSYKKLLAFLLLYENSINFGNHKNMTEQLQQRAVNLGKSLSYGILNFENPQNDNDRKTNAKSGRKYIIRLHKARTLEQFTEALISIMKKYGVSVSNEILENLNKENFIMVRQYAVIGALNGINAVLSHSS